MIGYRQIQQHYTQQHKGKSFKCTILHAKGTQQPLGAALGRHVTLKDEAVSPLYTLWQVGHGIPHRCSSWGHYYIKCPKVALREVFQVSIYRFHI